jgi:hypothetical protein
LPRFPANAEVEFHYKTFGAASQVNNLFQALIAPGPPGDFSAVVRHKGRQESAFVEKPHKKHHNKHHEKHCNTNTLAVE